MTDLEQAKIFRQAADYLDKKGWATKEFEGNRGKRCLTAAISAVAPGNELMVDDQFFTRTKWWDVYDEGDMRGYKYFRSESWKIRRELFFSLASYLRGRDYKQAKRAINSIVDWNDHPKTCSTKIDAIAALRGTAEALELRAFAKGELKAKPSAIELGAMQQITKQRITV